MGLDSSFYGLLDLLSGTELNAGQHEIGKVKIFNSANFTDHEACVVQTAKQSCELLLKVSGCPNACIVLTEIYRSSTLFWIIAS